MTQVPTEMLAIEIAQPGGPEVLRPVRLPVPRPGAGEILIRVAAAGVNRPDLLQRQGRYPAPAGASPIPGLEVAGTVVALGDGGGDGQDNPAGWRIGDQVTALVAGGGYAEYCVAPAVLALPIPAPLSLVEAACLPETFFTVWTNLFDRARLAVGDSVLIHGGASGIGTTAIQLAHRFGAKVFATAGGADRCRACEQLGATRAFDYHQVDFLPAVLEATGGRGVDVILDMVGGDYVQRNLSALAVGGRLVNIAYQKGAKVEIDLQPLMVKRLTMTGSTLRPRSVAEKGAIADALRRTVWPWLADGSVKPILDRRFPLAEAAEAHRALEAGGHIGKIVLVVG